MTIHSTGQPTFSFSHIHGITLGSTEKIDEVAGGASRMAMDRIGEVGDRSSKGQVAGMCGPGKGKIQVQSKGNGD